MDLATGAATAMALVAALGWWGARRLPRAANLERLRRLAKLVLASAVTTVASAAVYAAAVTAGDPRSGEPWVGRASAMVLVVPVLVVWLATIPRTWVLVRGRSAADPLSWVGPELRREVSSAVFVVPLASALVAAVMAAVAPSALVELPYGIGFLVLASLVAIVTSVIDNVHRRRRTSTLRTFEAPVLARTAG